MFSTQFNSRGHAIQLTRRFSTTYSLVRCIINQCQYQEVNEEVVGGRIFENPTKVYEEADRLICYLALCDICGKPYTGRTVEEMHLRINGHRSLYKDVLKRSEANTLEEIDSNTDQYTLGLHLHLEHGLNDPNAFDNHMKFGILEVVNPNDIAKKEYKWMHKLNYFQPAGINVEYPFGLPLLGQN